MNLLEQYKDLIEALCQKHKVERLQAFGSVLGEDFKAQSDIDLVVSFNEKDVQLYADSYFSLKADLEAIFQRPIDLLEEKEIRNPFLKESIQVNSQILYSAEIQSRFIK